MSETKKKILLGVLLLAIGIAGSYGLYYFFFRTPPPSVVSPTPTEEAAPTTRRPGLSPARIGAPPGAISLAPETAVPETPVPTTTTGVPLATPSPLATGGLTTVTTLTQTPVVSPARAANGKDVLYYQKDEGAFYRVTPDGASVPISDETFRDVQTIAWAPNGERAILEFPDGANILYDFTAKRQVTLPKHWKDFAFSPNSSKIVFKSLGLSPEDRWLVVSNPDGSGTTPVEPLGNNEAKVNVDWSPNQQMVATYTESRDGTRQELFFVGLHGENFRLAVLEGRQFEGQWTPKGDRLLYSVYGPLTDLKPSLWIVDAAPGTTGENRQHLDLATWADKCTIAADNTTAYCAVPQSLPRGAGIVRDIANEIPDDVYRLDLATGAKTLVAVPAGNEVTAERLMLVDDERMLVFTDKKTGVLQKIQLK